MNLFGTKGMSNAEARIIVDAFKKVAEAAGERLRGHDTEIAELRAELQRLKAEPRMTVAQRDEAWREIESLREDIAQLVEAMGMQGYGTLAIAAAIRKGKQ